MKVNDYVILKNDGYIRVGLIKRVDKDNSVAFGWFHASGTASRFGFDLVENTFTNLRELLYYLRTEISEELAQSNVVYSYLESLAVRKWLIDNSSVHTADTNDLIDTR